MDATHDRKDEMRDEKFIEDKGKVGGAGLNDHNHKVLTRKILLKLDFRYYSIHCAPNKPYTDATPEFFQS
jgi:hypothetical protein